MGITGIFAALIIVTLMLYGIILCYAWMGLMKHRTMDANQNDANPFFSIIIPVRNEAENILRCLESIRYQTYPTELFEVIIVDDFSTDQTVRRVYDYISSIPEIRWIVLESTGIRPDDPGKKRAIARGIARAQGSWIITTDADTHRLPEWLNSFALQTGTDHPAMLSGPVAYEKETSLFQKIQSVELLGIMGITAGFARLNHPVMCNGANLSYRKDVFGVVGGFRDHYRYASGDDQFLLADVTKRFGGESIVFILSGDAVVTVQAERSVAAFFQQRLRWISKAPGYRDINVIFIGLVIFLSHFFILAGFLMGMIHPVFLRYFLAGWLFKLFIDFPVIFRMAAFFRKRHLLWLYIPAQIFQTVYVVIIGLIGWIIPVRWKGRKI